MTVVQAPTAVCVRTVQVPLCNSGFLVLSPLFLLTQTVAAGSSKVQTYWLFHSVSWSLHRNRCLVGSPEVISVQTCSTNRTVTDEATVQVWHAELIWDSEPGKS